MPLDSFKKISGTVSHVEHKTFDCRVSRSYITECKRTIIRLKENESRFVVAGLDFEGLHIKGLATGDSIDLYTRHWYQLPLSFNSINEIYHLKKGQAILLDLHSRKSEDLTGLIYVGI